MVGESEKKSKVVDPMVDEMRGCSQDWKFNGDIEEITVLSQ